MLFPTRDLGLSPDATARGADTFRKSLDLVEPFLPGPQGCPKRVRITDNWGKQIAWALAMTGTLEAHSFMGNDCYLIKHLQTEPGVVAGTMPSCSLSPGAGHL